MKEGLDWIARGIAEAVADIRDRAVLSPWFGRENIMPGLSGEYGSLDDKTDDHPVARSDHDLPDQDETHTQERDDPGHAHHHHR